MYCLKRISFLLLLSLGLMLTPAALLWAQDSTTIQEPADEAYDAYINNGTYEEEVYAEDEEVYTGPFYNGFSINDTLKNLEFQQRNIDAADWKQLSEKPEYVYKKKINKEIKPKSNSSSWLADFFSKIIEFLFSPTGKVLMWLVLGLLVFWIVWTAFKNRGIYIFGRGESKIKKSEQDELADDFVPISWEAVIAQAEANEDYRLATRHAYRHIVHQMQEQKMLHLNTSQSNHQYLRALKDSVYFDDFKTLLKHYEYVWYGHYELGAASYQSVKVFYENLKAKLQTT